MEVGFMSENKKIAIIGTNGSQISKNVLQESNIFHTTCFALSKEPAQSTILKKAEEAFNLGCKLSIDLNYTKKLWDTQEEAIRVIKTNNVSEGVVV